MTYQELFVYRCSQRGRYSESSELDLIRPPTKIRYSISRRS